MLRVRGPACDPPPSPRSFQGVLAWQRPLEHLNARLLGRSRDCRSAVLVRQLRLSGNKLTLPASCETTIVGLRAPIFAKLLWPPSARLLRIVAAPSCPNAYDLALKGCHLTSTCTGARRRGGPHGGGRHPRRRRPSGAPPLSPFRNRRQPGYRVIPDFCFASDFLCFVLPALGERGRLDASF